tara:strand:- start:3580 stop:3993 length:414 start_codon:yes stop_codon:yes gene_type:complete
MDTEEISYLNQEVYGLEIAPIPIRDDIPNELLNYLQKLVERTIPVMSSIFPDDMCWQWVGALDRFGYGKHKVPSKFQGSNLVHRFIYQNAVASPDEATIDHACGNTACINLNHLRLLPRKLNLMYGDPRKLNTEEGN